MNKQIEWFCYHAVHEALLTPEQCRAVAAAMVEAGLEADLSTFAQAVVDNDLCSDVERLEVIMEMAQEEARTLGLPPESMLDAADTAAAPEAVETAATEPAAPAALPPPPVPRAPPGVTPPLAAAPARVTPPAGGGGDADWAVGWPELAAAEAATAAEARELMHAFLAQARAMGCSDVHVSTGAQPFVRRHKAVHLLPDQAILSPEASQNLNLTLLNAAEREVFERTHDLDYCYAVDENNRYRANVLLQRLGISGSYRIIDNRVRSLRELGFTRPEVIENLTTYHQGLILVTGPAGCGKSTTLAALVDLINSSRQDHIITVEDPIEVVHFPKSCNITQREIGNHTKSFGNALRAALREDPDIIVIGELRDLETIEMAIRASETGHLVIGTLHTGSAASTMDRVLDVFPPNQQAQIRAMAAESLKGVICQQLVGNSDGTGVCLATEIMLATLAVSNIIRDGETFKLPSIIQTSHNIGMSTMEQSFYDLYMAGSRTYEQTLPLVQNTDLIRQMQTREAQRAAAGAGTKKKKWF